MAVNSVRSYLYPEENPDMTYELQAHDLAALGDTRRLNLPHSETQKEVA